MLELSFESAEENDLVFLGVWLQTGNRLEEAEEVTLMNALRTWFWDGISSPVLVVGFFERLWEWGGTMIVYAWDTCMGLHLRCIWIKWMVDWVSGVCIVKQKNWINYQTIYIIATEDVTSVQSSSCTLNPDTIISRFQLEGINFYDSMWCMMYLLNRPQWNAFEMNDKELDDDDDVDSVAVLDWQGDYPVAAEEIMRRRPSNTIRWDLIGGMVGIGGRCVSSWSVANEGCCGGNGGKSGKWWESNKYLFFLLSPYAISYARKIHCKVGV